MASMLIEAVGWVGAILILVAYFLLTHGTFHRKDNRFHLMNLAGSVLLGINSYFNTAYPSFFTNIIWFFVALYGLHIIAFNRK